IYHRNISEKTKKNNGDKFTDHRCVSDVQIYRKITSHYHKEDPRIAILCYNVVVLIMFYAVVCFLITP
ncbi:MAG: hypothetical protein WCD42_08560, partial [Rhizomicrobium sp.]